MSIPIRLGWSVTRPLAWLAWLAIACLLMAGCTSDMDEPMAAPSQPDMPMPTPPHARLGSLAYVADDDIFVAKWDGSNPVKIADSRPRSECHENNEYWAEGPMWSPNGRYLAFRRSECDGPEDTRREYVVISDRAGNVVTSFPAEGWGIAWSPDSTRVAVWDLWPETIGVYGLDGERKAMVTRPPWMRTGETDPVWSPDGESLVFGIHYVIPLDGSTPWRVPWVFGRRVGWGSYSPDGSRVAYSAHHSFIVAEADGSDPHEVFGGWAGYPLWSPAGDRLAFVPNAFRDWVHHPLRVLDLGTGTVTELADWKGSEWISLLGFSPDGDRILFSRTGDGGAGESSLWTINVDGSDLRRLVSGTAQGDWFSPSPTQ